ncbi:MAG: hypothetical protein JXN61_12040, partial [Sedimentisphaerales bacterium]|nr:hypothetical protein [Sedimentisphaerales bacterium]
KKKEEAATPEYYLKDLTSWSKQPGVPQYTRQSLFDLDAIIDKVKTAIDSRLSVRIDVPLNRTGIKNVKELLILARRLESVGVKEIAYFQLHKTHMNKDVFVDLFVQQDLVTWELSKHNSWRLLERNDGQKVFYNGRTEMIIPTSKQYETVNCRSRKCGDYCQGIYASYMCFEKKQMVFRGCHREFAENTVVVKRKEMKDASKRRMVNIFTRLWSWAYNEER